MRVRLNRSSSGPAPKPGRPARRLHAVSPPPAPEQAPEHHHHRRTDEDVWRQAGGPEDRSTYSCRCGYVFEADVSTSVTCPHCGSGQAW